MPWGFAAAAIGSVASAGLGYVASHDAAKTQAKASNDASKVQLDMFNRIQGNEQPYMDAGTNALRSLMSGVNGPGGGPGDLNRPFTLADFHHSPGYNFQMQEGVNTIQNNASAQGGVNSGNTLKALTRYGQGVANQDYWNAYNSFTQNQNQRFGQLDTLAGSGQNAAANLGAIGSQTAASVGNNIIGAGNATSAGQVGGANAISNGLNGIGNNFLLAYLTNPGMFGGAASQPATAPGTQFAGAFPGGW